MSRGAHRVDEGARFAIRETFPFSAWRRRSRCIESRAKFRIHGAGGLVLMGVLASFCALPGFLFAGQEEDGQKPDLFQAGVLEVAGTTSFSVNYKKEDRDSGRETTHLRLTPSLGYFIWKDLEVLLQVSYVLDNLYVSAGNSDRAQTLLLALGPSYSFSALSDRVVPYAGLLFGAYYHHVKQDSSGTGESRGDLQWALGLTTGIRLMFTENLALKAGLQYVHGFEERFVGSNDFFGLELGMALLIPTWPAS